MTTRCYLQDHILPYILDDRHVEDTLFIVCEEDFRFFEEKRPGEEPRPKLQASQAFLQPASHPVLANKFRMEQEKAKLTTLQAHWQAREGVPGDHNKSASSRRSEELSFTTRMTKATMEELNEESPSPLLENLVRLCTAAHRKQLGDIVWFCYNEDDKKSSIMFPAPVWGANGIAVSRNGARWIKKEMPLMKVWHWDVELKQRLEKGHARASYIFPSCGHWTKHASGILKSNATRMPTWGAWFVQPGVAPFEEDHMERELWRWLKADEKIPNEGDGDLVEIIHLDEGEWPKLDWKTFFRRAHRLRDPEVSWNKSGSIQAPPPEPLTQEEMREQFDVEAMVGITEAGRRSRQGRDFRNQKMLAKLRVFTQSLLEAMCKYIYTIYCISKQLFA